VFWNSKAQVAQKLDGLDSFWKQTSYSKFWHLKSTKISGARGVKFKIIGDSNPKTGGISGRAEKLGVRQGLYRAQSHLLWAQRSLGKDDKVSEQRKSSLRLPYCD
jgi:hypothetical protein